MNPRSLLLAVCLGAAAFGPPAPGRLAPAALAVPDSGDAYAELVAQLDDAERELLVAEKAAEDDGERAKLRAERRALPKRFYARFAELADAGEGRALLWMASNQRAVTEDRDEVRAKLVELYGRLVREHRAQPWFEDVLAEMSGDAKTIGADDLEKLGEAALAGAEDANVRGATLYYVGAGLVSIDEKERGEAMFRRLRAELGSSMWAALLDPEAYAEEHLQIGKTVPEIERADTDGVAFKLSDYRGKVVMLDFWGDW